MLRWVVAFSLLSCAAEASLPPTDHAVYALLMWTGKSEATVAWTEFRSDADCEKFKKKIRAASPHKGKDAPRLECQRTNLPEGE